VYALDAIQDAYARLNRLSPGETLGPDEAAFAFTRLNLLVDEMSANNQFLYRDLLTSASVTGTITLGSGSWTAILPGEDIVSAALVSATAGNTPLSPIDARQYNTWLGLPATAGEPRLYYYDGLAIVTFFPVPTAKTIQLQTRKGVAEFADQNTTSYTVPPGYKSLLGASLAVRLAPPVLGKLPPDLLRAEKACLSLVSNYNPAILSVYGYTRSGRQASILLG
jgi:hypothetical protein